MPHAPFYTATVGVGLFMSARVAVQLAAGIGSLPRGQKMAATALGLTTAQAYRYVLLPMAFRIVLPPLTSEFLSTIKNTAVAITIGLIELTGAARSMQEFSFQVFEAFTAATVMYLGINVVVVVAMRFLERSVAIPGYITGK
jgi:glutamate/aspartate transport system permease protein